MIGVGQLKSLSWLKMMISSKTSTTKIQSDSPVNPMKFQKLLKSFEMMPVECIMVVFDGF